MRFLTRSMLMVVFTAAMAAAQTAPAPPAGWQSLNRLRPGQAVRVVLVQGGTIDGRVESWSAESVSLSVDSASARTLSAGEVKQVSVRTSHSRLKGAGIGAGIGFGAGFGLGALAAGTLTDQNNPRLGARAQAGSGVGVVGAGIGALLGALAGGSAYHTIYRAK